MATDLSVDVPEPSDADARSSSFWRSVQHAQSAVHSLSAVLGPLPDPHLAFSDDPAAALLRDPAVSEAVSRRLRLPSSGAGDDHLCRWLYDTFHSAVPTLRLAVLSFLPALAGAYLSRSSSSPSPSGPRHPLAGFEAVLLALYAHETVHRGGEPETVTLPSLAAPSIYHEVKPPSKKAAAEADELNSSSSATGPAVVSPALEPHGTVRSTRRARIVGVALELYYNNISQMPNFSKLEFCEFCTAWSGQDATFKAQKQGSSSPASASQTSDFQGEAEEGRRVPLPWELFQPMLRIVGHCLLGPGDSAELRTAAYKAAQCLHTRAAREIDSPTSILASRSLIRLGKIAAAEPEAAAEEAATEVKTAAAEVQEPAMEVQESAAEAMEPSVAAEAKEPSVAAEAEAEAEAKESSVAAEAKEPSVAAEAKEPSVAAEAKEPSVAAEAKEPSVAAEAEAKESSVAAEAKEAKESAMVVEAKESSSVVAEAKESSVVAEAKEPSVAAEAKESSVAAEAKEAKESAMVVEAKESSSVVAEAKEPSVAAEAKESSVAAEAKESAMVVEAKEPSSVAAEAKESSAAAEAKELSEAKESSAAAEAKESAAAEVNRGDCSELESIEADDQPA